MVGGRWAVSLAGVHLPGKDLLSGAATEAHALGQRPGAEGRPGPVVTSAAFVLVAGHEPLLDVAGRGLGFESKSACPFAS